MTITSVLVLFAVVWFMVLFIALPVRLKTQGDVGEVVPGTHAGAPANFHLKRKLVWVTAISLVVWLILTVIIQSGVVGVRDLDWFQRMAPPIATGGGIDG